MQIQRTTKVQQGRGIKITSIPQTIAEIADINKGTILEWTMTNENQIQLTIQQDTTKKQQEYHDYKQYLDELIQKDGITPTSEFYQAFDTLFYDEIIGCIVADYTGVKCFYEWNKENMNTGTKQEFIDEYMNH